MRQWVEVIQDIDEAFTRFTLALKDAANIIGDTCRERLERMAENRRGRPVALAELQEKLQRIIDECFCMPDEDEEQAPWPPLEGWTLPTAPVFDIQREPP